MKIILVRHGRPASLERSPISGRDLGLWVTRYNELGIARDVPPPESVVRLVATARCVVASDLRRSIESARWLTSSSDVRIDPGLREAALPESLRVSVRMPPGLWVVLARIAWWLRWCHSEETVDAVQQRAVRAADRLCALAGEHGSVAVVGHGMFNRFIARELVRRGWRGPTWLPAAHWTVATFMRSEQPV
jgi:broad specificity phosphatase PhoE